jgi:alkaline phosphatase
VRKAVQGGRARNVVLFIGDGMGDSEITVARNDAVGAAGRLTIDRLPLTGTDTDLPTILELAQRRGYRTGDVSTAELTDATPAVLAAHVAARSCRGPADMASCPQDKKSAGGPGSIAEQQIDHHVDVLLGGGGSGSSRLSTVDRTPAERSPSRRRARATRS